MRKILIATATLALAAGAATARPQHVGNGDFETGDFTSWTQFDDYFYDFVGIGGVGGGTYAAAFGAVGNTGGIRQTLSITAGAVVDISFYLASSGDEPSYFSADFDGANLVTQFDPAASGFVQYTFSGVVVNNTNPEIVFTFRNDPSYFALDLVTVTDSGGVVPLPSAAGLGFAGLTGLALRRRR